MNKNKFCARCTTKLNIQAWKYTSLDSQWTNGSSNRKNVISNNKNSDICSNFKHFEKSKVNSYHNITTVLNTLSELRKSFVLYRPVATKFP